MSSNFWYYGVMKRDKIIVKRIAKIKSELMQIESMHPGSLSKQYNVCGTAGCHCKDPIDPKKHGPYYKLSYVVGGKSTTRFIKPEFMSEIEKQILNYKNFKNLVDEWKTLSVELFKLRIQPDLNEQ